MSIDGVYQQRAGPAGAVDFYLYLFRWRYYGKSQLARIESMACLALFGRIL
jgi:hypothetical protein